MSSQIGTLTLAREDLQIVIQGARPLISDLANHPDLPRLFPGFVRLTSALPSIATTVAIDIRDEPEEAQARVEVTANGWLVRVPVHNVSTLLYGTIMPTICAIVTRKNWVYLDAAAALNSDGAVLLMGKGKSTTLWYLARHGMALISEDSVLLTSENGVPMVHGVKSLISIDVRNLAPDLLAGRTDQRGRLKVDAGTNWVASAKVSSVVYLEPTFGPASLSGASFVDRHSWIAGLVTDRAIGRNKFVEKPYMVTTWTWPEINAKGIDILANILVDTTSVLHLTGDLSKFADVLIQKWENLKEVS